MSKFDPPRRELWLRLAISVAGLALLVTALALRGIPEGPAFVEVVGVAGAFFGGSAIWCGWKLWKTR
ncbi:hypothetical protein GEU84_010850 [Fertoebacter nigrum]|uniref:Uncharacterized protein n=1 Tax=Fertoeibacter niger TaxID=2656921 RepID=A0A8X8KL31_9RHOB|nr:hypothetical protein [Fertoeibacter niger]NUB44884.1 hypothetical protein [Fertoeibacter niger]